MIRLLSVNLAPAGALFVEQSGQMLRVVSGIDKRPANGPVQLHKLGLCGDEQADLSVHGGLDKALYAYPSEHFPFWERQQLQARLQVAPLTPGAVGENLTLQGLLEKDVWIGDRLQIGAALLEVTEPRQPCYKFNAKMGFNQAVRLMVQSGRTGFYLRVLQLGALEAGAPVTLVPGPRDMPLTQVNALRKRAQRDD